MQTLSSANTANINDRTKTPSRCVRFPDMTFSDGSAAQWALGDIDGFREGLISLSALEVSVDPRGGVASYGTIVAEFHIDAIKDLIQNDSVNNEAVEVFYQYGTDAEIGRFRGIVDYGAPESEYRNDVFTLLFIFDMGLKGKHLPVARADGDQYSTYNIPTASQGKWVPFTFGAPYRPRALLVDHGHGASPTFAVNVAVSGHAGIENAPVGSGLIPYYVYSDGHYLKANSATAISTANISSGEILLTSAGGYESEATLSIIILPVYAISELGNVTNPNNCTNDDSSDYAELNNPAGDGVTAYDVLRIRVPSMAWPSSWHIGNCYFIGKITKTNALNHGGRTNERFHWGFEIDDGTTLQAETAGLSTLISSATAFNNYDGADAENASGITLSSYGARWGDDLAATGNRMPANRIGNRFMNIWMQEEDLVGGGDTAEAFRVYVAQFRIDVYAPADDLDLFANVTGYEDDGSGTYTGSANSLIETPSDVIHFLLAEIWGQTRINTTSISTARTAYGSSVIGGQFLDKVEAEPALEAVMANCMGTLFLNYDGNWTLVAFELPGSADITLDEASGDCRIVSLGHTSNEDIYNQFVILYDWDEARGAYNGKIEVDESSGGSVGTWLTDSQADHNVTRQMDIEARFICDATTATAFRNWLIYRYADQKRIVTFTTSFNGIHLELCDRVSFTGSDKLNITAASGSDSHIYEIFSIVDDFRGTLTFTAIQVDTSHAAL